MHELSLALDLLSAIERNLDYGDARVGGVGAPAGIMSESLRFAFRVTSEGTRANGADLCVANC